MPLINNQHPGGLYTVYLSEFCHADGAPRLKCWQWVVHFWRKACCAPNHICKTGPTTVRP